MSLSKYELPEFDRIRSYSGPYFPAFGLNTEIYSVSLRVQSECGKRRTRITPNTDTFYIVIVFPFSVVSFGSLARSSVTTSQFFC